MTKREMFARIASVCANDPEIVAFVAHEVELLDKKNKAPKKATKTQVENEHLKDEIIALLTENASPMTATMVAEKMGLSVNKVSALLTQLKEDNSVAREVVKRKAYFTIA